MSVIGSRFRIRLAEVRSWFVVSDVTTHDAWISTLPHSNVYFRHSPAGPALQRDSQLHQLGRDLKEKEEEKDVEEEEEEAEEEGGG